MLTSLTIKNYALIEEIGVQFGHGLTIITGETGAGKSILIDALGLLLGERASSEAVRTGAEKAVVEGVFAVAQLPKIEEFLRSLEVETGGELIVRREVSAKGTSRCFVNDSPVSLAQLKEIGDHLVDLHGQHEHQSLLRPETHIDFLDDFGAHSTLIETYRSSYRTLVQQVAKKKEFLEQEAQLKAKQSLYEFQIKEIDAVAPVENEESQLESELKILENAERLSQLTHNVGELLYENEGAIHEALVQVRKQLEVLSSIDGAFTESIAEARSAEAIVSELAKFIQQYHERIEFDPVRTEKIRERLGALTLLKKKYGGTVDAVIAHRAKIGEEFALAENFEFEIEKLEKEIESLRSVCGTQAAALTDARKSAAKKIQKSIIAALADLGIAKAVFTVVVEPLQADEQTMLYVKNGKQKVQLTSSGADHVEFFLSTNVGEDVKPLAKVASGGEVSRIMLALKSALADSDKTPLLIFDEIDTGVSGRIGQAVGLSLKKLSEYHQVVAITHLPQIAALADTHFAVEKSEANKRTSTSLRVLTKDERVHEVAKLLSGANVTDAGLKTAKELMGILKQV